MTKEVCLIGKDILGFDETNNGFNLGHHQDSKRYIIVTGYLHKNYQRAVNGTPKYGGKRGIFTSEGDFHRALERGRAFIDKHPDFLYTTIDRRDLKNFSLPLMKAQAVSTLSFAFFKLYSLNPLTSVVVTHLLGSEKASSDYASEVVETILHGAGISVPVLSKKSADWKNPAVSNADRIGYYVAALRFLGNQDKWPYRNHRISLGDFETLRAEASKKQFCKRCPLDRSGLCLERCLDNEEVLKTLG